MSRPVSKRTAKDDYDCVEALRHMHACMHLSCVNQLLNLISVALKSIKSSRNGNVQYACACALASSNTIDSCLFRCGYVWRCNGLNFFIFLFLLFFSHKTLQYLIFGRLWAANECVLYMPNKNLMLNTHTCIDIFICVKKKNVSMCKCIFTIDF